MTTKTQEAQNGMSEEDKKNLKVTFRVFQAIFLGIFALGISLIVGDLTTAFEIPISKFSLSTTIFGGFGAIITGILSNQCQEW